MTIPNNDSIIIATKRESKGALKSEKDESAFLVVRGDDEMELTKEQQDMLDGKYGEGTAYAMKIQVAI